MYSRVALGDRLDEGLDPSIIKSSGSSHGGKEIVFKLSKVTCLN
jgi:hypothetical protein